MATTLMTALAATVAAGLAAVPVYFARPIATGTYVTSISNGIAAGSRGNHAVIWNSGRPLDVHPAGFSFSAINSRAGNLSAGYAGIASLSQTPMIWEGNVAHPLSVPFDYVTGHAEATDGVQAVGFATETDPERGIGSSHALVWNLATGDVIDLGNNATLTGVGGGVQVGWQTGSRGSNAALWRGESNSFVDLHVASQDSSMATDTDGVIEVGYVGVDIRVRHEGRPRDIRFYSAGYWSGTAESFTYLPSAYRHSFALAVGGDTIVGYGNTTDAIGFPRESRAVAWIGPEHTFVDLHALLPADMRTSIASDVDETGNIVGYGVTTTGVLRAYTWQARTLEPIGSTR
jgi:hypothetical protein